MQETRHQSVDNSTENFNKKPTKTHKKAREDRSKTERILPEGITFKPVPDIIARGSKLSIEAKAAYIALLTLLPCRIPLGELATDLSISKSTAKRAIDELLARKIIFHKSEPGGSRRVVYGISVKADEWDLKSTQRELLGTQKRKRTDTQKAKDKKFLVSHGYPKKRSGYDMDTTKPSFEYHMDTENTDYRYDMDTETGRVYDSNILKDNSPLGDITSNNSPKEIEDRLALVVGPPPEERKGDMKKDEYSQRPLPLKTMIKGGKPDNVTSRKMSADEIHRYLSKSIGDSTGFTQNRPGFSLYDEKGCLVRDEVYRGSNG